VDEIVDELPEGRSQRCIGARRKQLQELLVIVEQCLVGIVEERDVAAVGQADRHTFGKLRCRVGNIDAVVKCEKIRQFGGICLPPPEAAEPTG
jgi:hypothetical protein